MKTRRAARLGAILAAVLAGSGCVHGTKTSADTAQAAADRMEMADRLVAEWSNTSMLAARRMLDEYGTPDEVRYGRLVWHDKGPWKRVVVRDIRPAYVEGDELGVIEQTVDYAAQPVQGSSGFPDGVAYDPRAGELTAKSDREELNYLRVNLADDVARGRLTVPQARDSYARIVELDAAGKSSPDMHRLRLGAGAP